VLTHYLTWRWCMLINTALAIPAFWVACSLRRRPRGHRPLLGVPNALAISCGLFALVFGLSYAGTSGWRSPKVLAGLAVALLLIGCFVLLERHAAQPMLPLGIFADRDRAGAVLALLVATGQMYSLFLFLTFYLQDIQDFDPIATGLAFLPLVVTVTVVASLFTARLTVWLGPRLLIAIAMLVAAGGFTLLTGLRPDGTYAFGVAPALMLIGAGLGAIFASAINLATRGVDPQHAGVAGATVNVSQQVGGSIGAALLTTVAATAGSRYLGDRATVGPLAVQATVHGYATAFGASATMLLVGALVTFAVLQPRPRTRQTVSA
jgi:predicted MFS family arabinose efflux permease